MDPTHKFEFSFPFNSPHGSSLPSPSFSSIDFTFNGFPDQLQLEGNGDQFAVNQPPECSQGALITPFLSKTFDLVDDPSLNPIISWAEKGESFVVWDPAYLATKVLPRCFRHHNFSSFVRQLNSYPKRGAFAFLQGFRKIDTDKCEFANEFFLRGSKHLLSNIQRRKWAKSPSLQQFASEGSGPGPGPEIGTQVEKLRTLKSVIMQEMAEIEQRQREAAKRIETITQKLVESETRQKKMLSFLANAAQNPEFIEGIVGTEEQSRRIQRKIVKPKRQERVKSSEAHSYIPVQTELMSDAELAGRGDSSPDNQVFSSLGFGLSVDIPETVSMSGPMVDSWSSPESYNFAGNGGFFSGGHLDTWELSHLISN